MIGWLRLILGITLMGGAYTVSSTNWSHTQVRLALVILLFVWTLVMAVIEVADKLDKR